MQFNLSDEQSMLVEAARRYVCDHYTVAARLKLHRTGAGMDRDRWADFAAMGWLALPVSGEVGGLGGSMVEIALLCEEFGRGLATEPFIDAAVLGGHLLSNPSPTARARTILHELIEGTSIAVLAHAEQADDTEYSSHVATRAVRTPTGWRLDGSKHLVVHGASADRWLVTARVDGAAGFGVFDLARTTPGVQISSYQLIDGSTAADLAFDGVSLSADALLFDADIAPVALASAADRAVIGASAFVVGSMHWVLRATSEYLKSRVQYGQPLSTRQALQHRLSEMLVETEHARSAILGAIAAVENGTVEEQARAVSGAKAVVTRASQFVSAQGIQLHGGIGLTDELAVSHHYKAAFAYARRFGDLDFHLMRSLID